jgi:hypothetical protein
MESIQRIANSLFEDILESAIINNLEWLTALPLRSEGKKG